MLEVADTYANHMLCSDATDNRMAHIQKYFCAQNVATSP